MNLENLHLEECPFGTGNIGATRNDLLYEALQQVAFLTKLILWIRCIYRRDFLDDHGKKIRNLGIRELTGDLRDHPDYRRYLSENHPSEDPLDLSKYTADLINLYRHIEMANGAAPATEE